jgi:hypothetical protein
MFMNISAELSLPPEERQDTAIMMSGLRSDIERLAEISPPIPASIIAQFKIKYKQYSEVSRPTIANGLESISVYERPVAPVHEQPPLLQEVAPPTKAVAAKPAFK